MKKSKILLFIGLFAAAYLLVDKIFKINYYKSNIVEVKNIQVSDDILIPSGTLALGKTHKGFIEGVVFPNKPYEFQDKGQVEYWYLRFSQKWYEQNIAPQVTKEVNRGLKTTAEFVQQARRIHKENFHYFMHANDFPIVHDDLIAGKIKMVGIMEKFSFLEEVEESDYLGVK
ncbi:MAG: hypothetical protein AAGG68_13150 [Bacteroidota bacterium]